MEWSEIVKSVRVKLKITQNELSKETGIPLITIARWETKNIEPQPKSLGKFLEYCKKNNIYISKEGVN